VRFIAALAVAAAALAGCSAAPSQGHPVIKIPETTAPTVPRVAPARIDIAKINAHSTLIPTGLNPDQSLATPDVHHPQQASYYCIVDPQKICSSGVIPGQPGPAVILGHIDGAKQKGLFYDLGKMQVGDTITITLKDGTVLTFQVYRILQQSKNQFPTQVVYQPTSVPEIRAITCTGPWVGGVNGYGDNLIVFASLVPNPPGA
jgi:flagellar basal body L-ring protein FlgH